MKSLVQNHHLQCNLHFQKFTVIYFLNSVLYTSFSRIYVFGLLLTELFSAILYAFKIDNTETQTYLQRAILMSGAYLLT